MRKYVVGETQDAERGAKVKPSQHVFPNFFRALGNKHVEPTFPHSRKELTDFSNCFSLE